MRGISRGLLLACFMLLSACELAFSPQPPSPEPLDIALREVVVSAEDFDAERRRRKVDFADRPEATLSASETGFYMDVQEARLRQMLSGTSVQIARNDNSITLTFPGQTVFDTGSARISDAIQPLVTRISLVLAEFDKTQISILGHTDDAGRERMNQRLSEQRGISVARQLQQSGVSLDRMIVVGYGEARPVANNETEEGRARNRRVDLILEPILGRTSG